MASSRNQASFGRDPFQLCPSTPGLLGRNDAADPGSAAYVIGDTAGPLGCNDHADPDESDFFLGVSRLHLTLSRDKDLLFWDYDPGRELVSPHLSPLFVEAAHDVLAEAVRRGLRPQVHEAYRSPEESDRKQQLWKKGKGGRAAAAWHSCHNYGLAMDVWLYDRKKKYIDNHVKGWYTLYKALAKAASGFVWGEGFGDGDADHFEYHPNWPEGASGAFLLQVKKWAQQAAAAMQSAGTPPGTHSGPVPEPEAATWMKYFWWAAGAGGSAPNAAFLEKNPPPRQDVPAKGAKPGGR